MGQNGAFYVVGHTRYLKYYIIDDGNRVRKNASIALVEPINGDLI